MASPTYERLKLRNGLRVVLAPDRSAPVVAVAVYYDVGIRSEPQGRTGFIRKGLERSVQAADTLVEGIDNAGVPDTAEGEEAAKQVADWAQNASDDLEEAQDSLDDEADSVEESIQQLTEAARAISSVLTTGVQTIAEVVRLDPELAAALEVSSTCQQLREETS